MLQIHLATNIRFLRKKQKLSQAELGSLLGLSRSNVASYENGNAEPSATKLARIARHFNMNLNQLIEIDLEKLTDDQLKSAHATIYDQEERLEVVSNFEKKANNLRKMTDGFRAFYHMRINQLDELPKEIKSFTSDYENLLNVMDNLVQSNQEMIHYLKTNETK